MILFVRLQLLSLGVLMVATPFFTFAQIPFGGPSQGVADYCTCPYSPGRVVTWCDRTTGQELDLFVSAFGITYDHGSFTQGVQAVGQYTPGGTCLDISESTYGVTCEQSDTQPIGQVMRDTAFIQVGTALAPDLSGVAGVCTPAAVSEAAGAAAEGAGAAGAGGETGEGESETSTSEQSTETDPGPSTISADDFGFEGSEFGDGTGQTEGVFDADPNQTSGLSGGSNSRENNNTVDFNDAVNTTQGDTTSRGSIDVSEGTASTQNTNSSSGYLDLKDAVQSSGNVGQADRGVIGIDEATNYSGNNTRNTGIISAVDAVSPYTGRTSPNYDFNNNLRVGSRGDDVKALQQFLNNNGYTVAQSGAGSPGNETSYFGPATQRALASYQLENGLGAQNVAGYDEFGAFGPETRGDINRYNSNIDSDAVNTQLTQQFPSSQNFGQGNNYLDQYYANNPYNSFNQGDNYVANLFPSSQNSGTNQVNNLFQNPGSGYRDDVLRLQNPAPSQYRFQENQGIVRGNNNAEIGRLQDYLISQNSGPAAQRLKDAVDQYGSGLYGGITEDAVREYQSANNLHQTGAFDNETRGYINGEQVTGIGDITEPAPETQTHENPIFTENLSKGTYQSEVRSLQNFLNSNGYNATEEGRATGLFGSQTESALRRYQADEGLLRTGILDQQTRDRIAGQSTSGSLADHVVKSSQNQTINFEPRSGVFASVHGESTWYGYANDPYMDSNSKKGFNSYSYIGIRDNNIQDNPTGTDSTGRTVLLSKPGDIAVSPDIERAFNRQGIELGDYVTLQTADGHQVNVRWNNRTADYLTGRFDFFSPEGEQPDFDIVGFRKGEQK